MAAALAAGWQLRDLFVTPAAAAREQSLVAAAAGDGVAVRLVADRVLTAIAETTTPQGVVAVVAQRRQPELPAGARLVAALVGAADPGNVGTVIRTADAAGADAVVLTAGSADVWSGKVVRASAGSLFHLPVVTGVAAAQLVTRLREAGLTVLATAADGEADLDTLIDTAALEVPVAWLFGNEAHGIDGAIRAAADQVVRLPIYGAAESLNLGAAAAICLYASARAQRR